MSRFYMQKGRLTSQILFLGNALIPFRTRTLVSCRHPYSGKKTQRMWCRHISMVCVIIAAWTGAVVANVNDGLMAYWSFNACDFQDDSGNGFDEGTAPERTPLCVPGAQGNALAFDGNRDNFIRIPDVPVSDRQHSYALWFRPAVDLDATSPPQDLMLTMGNI